MNSFVRIPTRTTIWKCPKCGAEEETEERPSPLIHTGLSSLLGFGGGNTPPTCPKCKVKMEKEMTWRV